MRGTTKGGCVGVRGITTAGLRRTGEDSKDLGRVDHRSVLAAHRKDLECKRPQKGCVGMSTARACGAQERTRRT